MNPQPISENFSEKPKRGRPRLLSEAMEQLCREATHHDITLRSAQNKRYLYECANTLAETPNGAKRFAWLLRGENYRRSVLYQLGRIKDKDALLVFADELCKRKPKAQEAIALVREWAQALKNLEEAA